MYRDPPPDAPKSVFEIPGFARDQDEAREWLETAQFPADGPLHLPDFEVVQLVRDGLQKKAEDGGLYGVDVLRGYEWLRASAKSSDYVCGKKDPSSGARCGGVMDIQVTATGLYYVCRMNPKHKYLV